MYTHKTPVLLKWFYPSCVWAKPQANDTIYLTFDDGPIPEATPFILETLQSFNIKATFFCVVENISKYPEILQEVKRQGHRIGNHTYNHLNGWDTKNHLYIENIKKGLQVLNDNGVETNLFRPPYGKIRFSQVRRLRGFQIIMWDVLSGDFDQKLAPHKCLINTIKSTSNGSVVVFHDNVKAFENVKYVLPRYIKHFIDRGFSFDVL